MPKTCKSEGCNNPVFSKGYCKYHQNQRTDEKWLSKKQKTPKKSFKPISDKRVEQLAKYRTRRDKYLKENPICEVKGCNKKTTNLHHKAGRIGEMLYDVQYFMACCSECHPKKIHENPKWARENGYLI